MKFIFCVEGRAEKNSLAEFIRRWLDRRVTPRVGIATVPFKGCSHLLKDVVQKVKLYLQSPDNASIIAVVGLLDLYGLPAGFFPGHLKSTADKYDWGVQNVEKQVGDPRFKMFFAVHEFEAWLFSDPSVFPKDVSDSLKAASYKPKLASPEAINFDEPPAKLLNALYKNTKRGSYNKVVDARQLFSKLDPEIAAKKCPYLNDMFEKLVTLANARRPA